MNIWNIINLFGGLALFIFGMNLMSDGLKLVAGSYLKKILEKLTKNRIIAMMVGAGLTALIQSSNAMCVMVVGFVNAGMMQLERSVGILMGAKIGTTITGQLIAFNISEVAPVIAFVGVVVTMFAKKPKIKNVGQMLALSGVMAFPGAFAQAFYIMLGMNIGASVAPALASISGRKDAKRVAFIVILFESIGMVFFLIATTIFPQIFDWILATSPGNPTRQIANANTIFNLVTVLMLLPCGNYLVRISRLVICGEDEKETQALHYIDESGYQSGTVLIGQIDKEVGRMYGLVRDNLEAATKSYFGKMKMSNEQFAENEAAVDFLNKEIVAALIRTSEIGVSEKEAKHTGNLYHIVTDLERIGDHAENVLGYQIQMKENEQVFSDKALKQLKELSQSVYKIFDLSCEHFGNPSEELYYVIYNMEDSIDKMVDKMRASNTKRLSKHKCEATQGLYFNEILVDLERVADHSLNIAQAAKKYEIYNDDDE